MKSSARFSFAMACFGLLSVAGAPNAYAEFKCDRPQLSRVDATACAKAAESPSSLRRYVWRTQAIYGLQMSDYMRFEGDAPTPRSAPAAQAPAEKSVVGLAQESR